MSEPCTKENELGRFAAILEKLEKEIFGDGNEGMRKTVNRLENKFDHIMEFINNKKEKEKLNWRKAGIIISAIIGISGIVVTLINKFG